MHEFLVEILQIVIVIFLVSTMLSTGLSLTLKQIVVPLRNARLMASSLAVSYVVVPLVAIITAEIVSLDEPLKIGLVLMSMAAGAEPGPKITGIAKGNIAFSVGLLAVQLVVTIICFPLILSVLLPEVHVKCGTLLPKLFATVLVPLVLGLFLRAHYSGISARFSRAVQAASTIFLVLTVMLVIVVNYDGIIELAGSEALLGGTLFVIISYSAGYLLGGPSQGTRRALGIMSGARNASISLMIASQTFNDPRVLLVITATVILMLVILLPAAYVLGRCAG